MIYNSFFFRLPDFPANLRQYPKIVRNKLALNYRKFELMETSRQNELIKGEIADYRFEDGILYSYSRNPRRTIENISANVALVKNITGGKKIPLLIYLSNSPVPDKATRKFATEQLPNVYTAMALVSKTGLSKLIMNILFRFKPPPIPMRSFSDDVQAKEWLKQFI